MSEGTEQVGRGASGAGGAVDAPMATMVDPALYDEGLSLQWAEEMQALTIKLWECREVLMQKIASDGPGAVHPRTMPLDAMLTLSAIFLASYESQKDPFGEAVLGTGSADSPAGAVLSDARLSMLLTAGSLLKETGELAFLATMDTIEKSMAAMYLLYEGLVISTGVRLWEGLPAVQRTPLPPQWRFDSLVDLARNGGVGPLWSSTEAARPFACETAGRVRAALVDGASGTVAVPRLPTVPRRN